jgi:hypothetical protein
MSQAAAECPKCHGQMELGFLLDYTHGGVLVSPWVRGAPKKSFWGGLKTGLRSDSIPVGAFRCQACGFLELYARNEFAAK